MLPGRIELHLAGQKLVLSQAFRERMAALFPGDPLPDIFTPPAEIQASTAMLPLEVRVHYGSGRWWPLIGRRAGPAGGGRRRAMPTAGRAACS